MAPNAVVKLLGKVVPTMDVCCRLGLLLRFLRWPFPLDVSSLAFCWLVRPLPVDDDWDKRLGMTTNDCGTFLHAVKALERDSLESRSAAMIDSKRTGLLGRLGLLLWWYHHRRWYHGVVVVLYHTTNKYQGWCYLWGIFFRFHLRVGVLRQKDRRSTHVPLSVWDRAATIHNNTPAQQQHCLPPYHTVVPLVLGTIAETFRRSLIDTSIPYWDRVRLSLARNATKKGKTGTQRRGTSKLSEAAFRFLLSHPIMHQNKIITNCDCNSHPHFR